MSALTLSLSLKLFCFFGPTYSFALVLNVYVALWSMKNDILFPCMYVMFMVEITINLNPKADENFV